MQSAARRTPLVVVLAALIAVLAGCGGSKATSVPPATRLAQAKAQLDRAPGVHVQLSTPSLPSTVNGLLSADGVGTRTPAAFQGQIRVQVNGMSLQAQVIAVGGRTYVQIGKWSVLDPAQYGAPDPAALFGAHGLSQLLVKVDHPRVGQDVRDGKRILSSITGSIPGSSVAGVIPSAVASQPFKATFVLDDTNRLQQAVLTGPFYPKAPGTTYTFDFSDYGVHPKITSPK